MRKLVSQNDEQKHLEVQIFVVHLYSLTCRWRKVGHQALWNKCKPTCVISEITSLHTNTTITLRLRTTYIHPHYIHVYVQTCSSNNTLVVSLSTTLSNTCVLAYLVRIWCEPSFLVLGEELWGISGHNIKRGQSGTMGTAHSTSRARWAGVVGTRED